MTARIGHNGGPTMEPGASWRRYCWKKARADLLGEHLPLETIRRRVARAEALGLEYKTYASVRAATGEDIIALLFSSNALRIARDAKIAEDRARQLSQVRGAVNLSLVQPPLDPAAVIEVNQPILAAADRAPGLSLSWSATRDRLVALARAQRIRRDGILVVGCTDLEREWLATGGFAGYLDAGRYFPSA